jgi:hypothetical protein
MESNISGVFGRVRVMVGDFDVGQVQGIEFVFRLGFFGFTGWLVAGGFAVALTLARGSA